MSTPFGTPQLLAGLASMTVDGTTYDLFGSLKYSPSVVDRTDIVGMSGVFGWKEMPTASKVSATIMDNGSLFVSSFNRITNSTITCALANGKSVVLSNAWCTGVQEVDPEAGTFEVHFSSPNEIEILG